MNAESAARRKKEKNGMIKFFDHEEIFNLENSEDYGILHISNFKPFGRYKKFYVYRVDKNGTVIQSKPFISDLEGTRELKKRGIKLYFDSDR